MSDTPRHPQTKLYGVDVDAGMARLLEDLWGAGLDTQFSCQGDPERYRPVAPTDQWAASITFSNLADGCTFLDTTVRLLGGLAFDHDAIGSFVLTPLDPDEIIFADSLEDLTQRELVVSDGTYTRRPQVRAHVNFPPSVLGEVTAAWARFAAPVCDYDAAPAPSWSIDDAWAVRHTRGGHDAE